MRGIAHFAPTFIAVYALLYAAFGLQSPFLPALLQERGLRADELGIVLAAATATRIAAGPLIGHIADRRRQHTLILCGCALLAALAGLGYVATNGFKALLVVALLHAAMLAPIVPLSDALATTSAQGGGPRARRFEYGWIRAAGSAAFVIGTTFGGWFIGTAGLGAMPVAGGMILAMGGVVSLLLPALRVTSPVGGRHPSLHDVRSLLRLPVYRRMLLVAALVEGSHALHDSFAVVRWHDAGIDLRIIGLLWSESVLAEVVVFLLVGPWLLRRLTPGSACALAAAAGGVRWTVTAFTTAPLALGVMQPLHGLTFALLHLACMRLIVGIVPVRLSATAQSVYGTLCVGAATALLTLASGLLYQRMGGHAFLAMATLCLIALPLSRSLRMPAIPLVRPPVPAR